VKRLAGLALLLLTGCDRNPTPPSMVRNATLPAAAIAAAPIIRSPVPDPVVAPASVAKTTARPSGRPLPARPRRPVPDYRALGTEPFWAVTVRGRRLTLERPDHSPLGFDVDATSGPAVIRYRGDGFTMTLTPGPCSDGMSDTLWSDRVQIAFAGGTLKGCGGTRESMGQEHR
jgi:uncharacterized membrane protein